MKFIEDVDEAELYEQKELSRKLLRNMKIFIRKLKQFGNDLLCSNIFIIVTPKI